MIVVRGMAVTDIVAAQPLLEQLGYKLDNAEIGRRYDAVARSPDHVLTVAEQDGRLIALCHAYLRPALDKPPEVVVQALVVDTAARGTGVGRLMMADAERWAAERGMSSVSLASHVARSAAHSFYEGIGYQRIATSHLFRKALG